MGRASEAGKVVAFAGPTLPPDPGSRWQRLLSRVELRPPAQRGDVLNALSHDPEVLVLLDGYYFTVPSVTHKEILYALEAGVRVIGGASMGALRAAELHPFGMEGVGWVFEQLRDGHLDGDDEVAVLHASEDFRFRPLTVALVDVRAALLSLTAEGLPAPAAEELVAAIKALPFTDRHGRRVEGLAREILGEEGAASLRQRLRGESVKERDARAALEKALEDIPRHASGAPSSATTFLGYFHEWHLEVPGGTPETRCTVRQAAHVFQVLHPQARDFVASLRRRLLLAAAARRRGLTADPRRVEELTRQLEGKLLELHGGCLLPAPERLDEARDHALAEAALASFGSVRAALIFLSGTLGLDPEDGLRSLETLLALQDDLLPAWWIARGIVCSTAFPAAVTVARRAAQIHRAFQTWKSGARIRKKDLEELAAELWQIPREGEDGKARLQREAGARGLFDAGGFSPGFREALELIAAAERLPRPINDYPRAKRVLQSASATPLLLPIPRGHAVKSLRATLQD